MFLRVEEPKAVDAMPRAVEWLASQALPDGMVLRVPSSSAIVIMSPQPWRTAEHSTNPLERLHKEVKRRSEVVGIFPNRASLVLLFSPTGD